MSKAQMVPVLETERLRLRGHETADISASAAMWADEQVVAHITGKPFTYEQSWSRLLRYAGHWLHLGFGYWAVTSKADGSFLGEVGFADYRRDTKPNMQGKPEAGWVLNQRSQGKGIATEAVTAMMDWADSNLSHTSSCAMFDPSYAASINVARKVGYENEMLGRYGNQEVLFMERLRQVPQS